VETAGLEQAWSAGKELRRAGSMPVLADVTGCEIYSWGCPLADGSFVVGVNERYELEAVLATTN
jgi:hypothetical protein